MVKKKVSSTVRKKVVGKVVVAKKHVSKTIKRVVSTKKTPKKISKKASKNTVVVIENKDASTVNNVDLFNDANNILIQSKNIQSDTLAKNNTATVVSPNALPLKESSSSSVNASKDVFNYGSVSNSLDLSKNKKNNTSVNSDVTVSVPPVIGNINTVPKSDATNSNLIVNSASSNVPISVTNATANQTTKVDALSVAPKNTVITQTFKETQWVKLLGLIMCVLIVLFWITVIILSTHISTGPKLVERNVTVQYYSPIKIDYISISSITDTTYNNEINVLGYLRIMEDKKYIMDDYNKTLLVDINGNLLFNQMFLDSSTNKKPYNITGIYSYNGASYVVNITNIIPLEKKPLQEIREQRMENITEGDPAGVDFDLTRGIVRMFSVLM